MADQLFGTDGVRGRAGLEPMTAATALRIGQAVGARLATGGRQPRALIGKDPRLSSYMIEQALTAGLLAAGVEVLLVGPMPTPAVAMLVRAMRADLGVMVSASHNPWTDNGVKLFGADGFKLSDTEEAAVATAVLSADPLAGAADGQFGRARRIGDADGRYIEFVKQVMPRRATLDGFRIAVDCANGAAYKVAPTVLRELGAQVVALGVEPDGRNINRDCGATAPGQLAQRVVAEGCDLGIALDGDADRLILIDESGAVVDGDQIIALLAERAAASGELRGGGVVATVMSNLGLERHLGRLGLDLARTRVGDRWVVEEMRRSGRNIGGEQSGHVVLTDHATTGDGLLAALRVLAALIDAGRPASALLRRFRPMPQVLRNVRLVGASDPLAAAEVRAAITAAEARFGDQGRVLIRKSGTEPVVRVMAEGVDAALVAAVVEDLATTIARAAA
jgi:phosphoglucosamine mutase